LEIDPVSEMREPAPVPAGDDARRRDAFARLFAQHQRWLYGYLMTLLANPADAEEVFQEVCVVLWREYEKFQLGTNFVSWVSVIVHHQVHRFRRQQRRGGWTLSEQAIEAVASETAERFDVFEARRQALAGCIEGLSDNDRQLVGQCYSDRKVSFKRVANELGRPANTVYKALGRIRRVLYDCIERKLAAEEWS